ncbi:MAG: V-type ATP synthase subunit D [Nanoarchaeota archaeon]|nr:V-type ATP synthase subunit D [Nanoarchaeota archaeon]
MVLSVSANRSELLKLKDRSRTAQKGHSLLKKKRDGLIIDFFKLLEHSKDVRAEMNELYKKAQKELKLARINSFELELKLLAKGAQGRATVDFQSKNIMGLSVPQIKSLFEKRNFIEQKKTPFASLYIRNTISSYDELLEKIVQVAEIETALIKLLKEIEKTKRRVNGLEFSIIPELQDTQKYVQLVLDEQERDALIALKKIKAKIDKKKLN